MDVVIPGEVTFVCKHASVACVDLAGCRLVDMRIGMLQELDRLKNSETDGFVEMKLEVDDRK